MKEGIGETMTLYIIIIFIVITFAFITGAMNYYKAFKVNSSILYTIEKYEGYNTLAANEINKKLEAFGYFKNGDKGSSDNCPESRGDAPLVTQNNNIYNYCVYYYSNDSAGDDNSQKHPKYYNYSVISYISLDLPIIGNINIPVHTKGERIYRFGVK